MKMPQWLSGRTFDAKCKRWIQRTMDRTKVLRQRSETMQSFLIKDIEELLRIGLDSHAYSKAEEVCAERNRISYYKSITQFCECILSHLSSMQKERECPMECQEAVSSLIFAAERISRAPELIKLRDILKERYGDPLKSFVNEEFASKLESKSSSDDMKLQLLRDISQRLFIGWDSRGLESELSNINPSASSNKLFFESNKQASQASEVEMFARWVLRRRFHKKCKSLMKAAMARIEIETKRRKAMEKFLSSDIAELLRGGMDAHAYSKAEWLCAELIMISCYNFMDQFCGCIFDHLPPMLKERECPKECREAVASLIFAASRMSNVPELRELRSIWEERYGNSLESFVNKEFVQKMRSKSTSKDMRFQSLQDIAQAHSIHWDSKALEQMLLNPPASHQDQKEKISLKEEDGAPKYDDGDANGEDNQRSKPSLEDNGGHQDFSSSGKGVHVKEKDDRQYTFTTGIVPPPYTRPEAGKPRDGDALPGGELDEKPGRIPATTNGTLEIKEEEVVTEKLNPQVGEGEGESKLKPRSIRRKRRSPPACHDQIDISVKTNPRKLRQIEDPTRVLPVLNVGDHHKNDHLEELLMYVSIS